MRIIKLSLLIALLLAGYAQAQTPVQPVLQVDYPYPTTDKPQSKLWYAGDCWWAILPRSGGPSLWQRTATGWKEHPEVYKALQGIPGRADVWADKDGVTAVGVTADSLVVFRLTAANPDGEWHSQVLATLHTPVKENIETATIARDAHGQWWVAADGNTSIYTWSSANGLAWSQPLLLKAGVSKDDIAIITSIQEGVMVTWSNQVAEAVQYRVHKNGHAATDWEEQAIVEAGNKTADDHLHAALTSDGTVWMVTKNSLDSLTYPQLVLRVRAASGTWRNFPYAPRTAQSEPSRPVIITTPQKGLLLEGHTIYDKTDRYKDRIEFSRIDTTASAILTDKQVVIQPATALHAKVNDCTVSKAPFPADAPWIVLASDAEGRVYEADLRLLYAK